MRNSRKWFLALAVMGVLGIAAAFWGDRSLKGKGHPGLRVFIAQWWNNYPASFDVEIPVIRISVDDKDLEHLEAVVANARERGVIMPEGNDYVKARCEVGNEAFKADLRIKGKLTDHVEGRKWSFRVIAKKSGGFLGMKRFSLQHPGTRNYLCDWFYHRISHMEGIVALRYGFCKVEFNGDDLGVYAYEEHFGGELLENNGRLKGPILRFDPDLYWTHRLNSMRGRDFDEAYAEYRSAAVDAYDSDEIAKDPEQMRYFQQAMVLLDGFRRGELNVSEVFDTELMARRHAIIDLVGGHHSMDWSDVKFYYDPAAQRIQPISYESFSAFPTKQLAGAYRFTGRPSGASELHEALFNDEDLFRAYVGDLERISRKEWLDSVFTAIGPALDTAAAMMYREFPYKELDRSIYYRNQDVIHRMLDVPKGFHAYYQGADHDTITLALVPVNSLPVEVGGLRVNGRMIPAVGKVIVPAMPRRGVADPILARFVIDADSVDTKAMVVGCRVLGASVQKEVEVFPYALPGSEIAQGLVTLKEPNVADFAFLVVDEAAHRIAIREGAWKADHDMIIPAGYRVVNAAPFTLDLTNGALLLSRSPFVLKGNEEQPVLIMSSDSTSRGFHVIGAGALSTFERVGFRSLMRYAYEQPFTGDVTFHRSDVHMKDCTFEGTGATLLDISTGSATLTACSFTGGSDQIEVHHAALVMNASAFTNASDDAISVVGGSAQLTNVSIDRPHGVALKATTLAQVSSTGTRITDAMLAFEGREGAQLSVEGGVIARVGRIGEVKKSEMRYGPVRLGLKGVEVEDAKERFVIGEGSVVIEDGVNVNAPRARATE